MKYALIGCGRISPNHVAAAQKNELDIVALVDLDENKTKDVMAKVGLLGTGVHVYTDYKKMLETEKPEVVAVATESGKHAQIALNCLDYGCHLIIEKPIALSIADADAVIAKAREKEVVVCVCHQNRFNKSIQKIRDAIEQKLFGKMLYGTAHIRWNRGHEYYAAAGWRGTWEQDGGALMNQCIHNIDLLRWMMGDEIDVVYGMTDQLIHPYIEAEDFGIAIIKFRNGNYGIVEGTTGIYSENLEETLYLFGEKGTVKVGGKSVNAIEEWRFADCMEDSEIVKREYSEYPPNVYGYGHAKLYRNVVNAIHGEEELLVDGEAGKRALELVLAIYQSAATGLPVRFPIMQCGTLDFAGRFKKEK